MTPRAAPTNPSPRSWLARNRLPLLAVVLAAVGVGIFVLFYYAVPGAGLGPEQPIPFSHRVHAGVKNIKCQFCHPYVAYSKHPGIPPVEKCLYCHKYIIAKHPWIQEEHRYFNQKIETPWRQVNYLPEHVLFNHQRHIRKDIACQECHGKVEQRDRLNYNRFLMGFCVDCHRLKKANLDCWLGCHS